MKKYTSLLVLTIAMSITAFGNSDPKKTYAVAPKPVNMDNIVEAIGYPSETKNLGIEGLVLVYVEINEQGEVTSHTLLSAPNKKLKETVEQEISKLKFEPARNQQGLPVASAVRIPFKFQLTLD